MRGHKFTLAILTHVEEPLTPLCFCRTLWTERLWIGGADPDSNSALFWAALLGGDKQYSRTFIVKVGWALARPGPVWRFSKGKLSGALFDFLVCPRNKHETYANLDCWKRKIHTPNHGR